MLYKLVLLILGFEIYLSDLKNVYCFIHIIDIHISFWVSSVGIPRYLIEKTRFDIKQLHIILGSFLLRQLC